MNEHTLFILLIALAMLLRRAKFLYPLKWLETYFHELSHGLAAILTFGRIHSIRLQFNGAGVCKTQGGWRIPILLAGYAGAVGWGALIYLAGWVLADQQAFNALYALMGLLVFSTLFWVRDLQTLIIVFSIFSFFLIPTLLPNLSLFSVLLQFVGLYILLSAIAAPLALIDGKHVGDGAELANITYLPEGVWIMLWFAMGLIVLLALWQLNVPVNLQWVFTLFA